MTLLTIQLGLGETGLSLYAYLRSGNQYWKRVALALENYNAANYATQYAHHGQSDALLAENGVTGDYTGTIETTGIPDATYQVVIRRRAGATPAPTDGLEGGGSVKLAAGIEVESGGTGGTIVMEDQSVIIE